MSINEFLLSNGLLINHNPAISPDMALDIDGLLREITAEQDVLQLVTDRAAAEKAAPRLQKLTLWPKSIFFIKSSPIFVIESKSTGDCALITPGRDDRGFENVKTVGSATCVIPLSWQNLIRLKNLVLENDSSCTIFPKADGALKTTSLGIGARFTTLHWPAVAWVMKALRLPLTANQNSIPRELVYDVEAMLGNRLAKVPFPFIGASVPEGHQGQSVQGMSHAAIITFLKYGFHHNKIPWGFNADHQPIGGRFDAVEKELVEGSLFASYITYDMSPELSAQVLINDPATLEETFRKTVDQDVFHVVVKRLAALNLQLQEFEVKKLVTFLTPAMKKLQQRDERYTDIRQKTFTTDIGRRFFKELSIDELPGETTPATLAVCLAMSEAMGMRFDFVAPNIGFQKNIPYEDAAGLAKKITSLFAIVRAFNMSMGFHSGSGKSAENYRTIGAVTAERFEIKTSGRYTYEMGVALSRSSDSEDRKLWLDWYDFTRQLAVQGAFSDNAVQRSFARDFIVASLEGEGVSVDTVFSSPENLQKTLAGLKPSPDHPFWFEYNFLFVLAGKGSIGRLGDHSAEGYEQRSRFYRISDQAKLLFAKRIAEYIIFLAESTGIASAKAAEMAGKKLGAYKNYEDLVEDIG